MLLLLRPESVFQSTRPVKGATAITRCGRTGAKVSIHAPREGRDLGVSAALVAWLCFNPRAP